MNIKPVCVCATGSTCVCVRVCVCVFSSVFALRRVCFQRASGTDPAARRGLLIISPLITLISDSFGHYRFHTTRTALPPPNTKLFPQETFSERARRGCPSVDRTLLHLRPCCLPSITLPLGGKETEKWDTTGGERSEEQGAETKEGVTTSASVLP